MTIVLNEALSYDIPAAWTRVDRQTRSFQPDRPPIVIDHTARDRMLDAIAMAAYPWACQMWVVHRKGL